LNTGIFELSEDEIALISGAGDIDPPATVAGDEYPQVDNDPPG
jgi:hypothetical protein